jgi:glycosyltransferase involved in cell wall biosynthesis
LSVPTDELARPVPDRSGRRLLFVIGSLAGGGAERVLGSLAGDCAARGDAVTVVTLAGRETDLIELDARIERVALDLSGAAAGLLSGARANLRRVLALRRAIVARAPDAVVAFLTETNVLSVLATRGTGIPVVVSERVDPRHHALRRGWERLVRATYRRAARVVANSPSVAEWLAGWLGAGRVACIQNGVEPPPAGRLAQAPEVELSGAPLVVALGRLAHQKGHDVLLRAFAHATATEERAAWELVVLGEGEERGPLEALVRELGLGARVRLPGRIQNPWSVLARAQVFALASRYEGQPNALLEAMAVGLPAVVCDSGSGPGELVDDGVHGLVVPVDDVAALAHALGRLLDDAQLRRALGDAARRVTVRHGRDASHLAWNELLDRVIAERRPLLRAGAGA